MAAGTYYLGQGRVFSRIPGQQGLHWWGDVSGLQLTATEETVSHRESYSGFRRKVRTISFINEMTLTATIHQIDVNILAQVLRGTVIETPAGAVTSESLGTVAVGDVFKLENGFNVDNVVITDSAGTPVTIDPQHYDINAASGLIEFFSLPTTAPTMPLLVSYEHGATRQVVFQNKEVEPIEIFFEGVNLAEGAAPVSCQLYRVKPGTLQNMALINDATALASLPWTGEVEADTTKPANGMLGQIGRYIETLPEA